MASCIHFRVKIAALGSSDRDSESILKIGFKESAKTLTFIFSTREHKIGKANSADTKSAYLNHRPPNKYSSRDQIPLK